MHQYRWYSNIKWGTYYNPETEAHHRTADSVEDLLSKHKGNIDLQSLQVWLGDKWQWVTEVQVHLGGIAKHWHGERI